MKFTSMIPTRSGSGSSSSRYGSTKSSGYGTGSSSGYGSSGYGSSGYGSTSSYDSGYNSRSSGYGSGVGSYSSSNYTSPYSSNYSSGSGYTSSGYGRSSAREYDTGNGNANTSYSSGSSGYSSRATSRDRSSERSLDNLYTPRNSRRSLTKDGNSGIPTYQMNRHRTGLVKREPKRQTQEEPSDLPRFRKGLLKRSGSTSDYFAARGLRKSSSYSGFHWIHQQAARDNEEKKQHKAVNVNDIIYKSHRRQGSNSSVNSDVFEEPKSGISRSRDSSLRSKPPKRDLEAILGKEDHMLVQRIIEENKAIMEETQAKLTTQEEKLIKKIMEASMTGSPLDCLDVLTIIESC